MPSSASPPAGLRNSAREQAPKPPHLFPSESCSLPSLSERSQQSPFQEAAAGAGKWISELFGGGLLADDGGSSAQLARAGLASSRIQAQGRRNSHHEDYIKALQGEEHCTQPHRCSQPCPQPRNVCHRRALRGSHTLRTRVQDGLTSSMAQLRARVLPWQNSCHKEKLPALSPALGSANGSKGGQSAARPSRLGLQR